MGNALKVVAERYSEQQLMKAQDIIGDLRDELKSTSTLENKFAAQKCDQVWDLLSDIINLDTFF